MGHGSVASLTQLHWLILFLSQRAKEHKKAEAAGTRAPVKANGNPVKPPKPTSIVSAFII